MMYTQHRHSMRGTQALVMGAGRSGQAASLLLARLGAHVRLLEEATASLAEKFVMRARQQGIKIMQGPHTKEQFAGCSLIVLSPGIPVRRVHTLLGMDPDTRQESADSPEIISELELAGRFIREKVLAVTGTNGKTSTTALCAHVLRCAGHRVFEGGNIGAPLSEYLLSEEKAEILVLEVSSFQAQNLIRFAPDVGILLNISPNHLDYHADMEEYRRAKLRLFAQMQPEGVVIVPAVMKEEIARQMKSRAQLRFFEPEAEFVCPALPGPHNQHNITAAWEALSCFGIDRETMHSALKSFVGHPHRLEQTGKKRGVLFVNDSKGTTIEALRAALGSFAGSNILLLAGGVYKGGDLHSVIPLLKKTVRTVCLFGGSREIFEQAWQQTVPLLYRKTLQEAMHTLFAMSRAGEVILLSPATSSFDQYANYEARGMDFQQIYGELS